MTALTTNATAYRSLVTRRIVILTGLTVALILSLAVDISLGPARYPLWDVLHTIVAPGWTCKCGSSSGTSECRWRCWRSP